MNRRSTVLPPLSESIIMKKEKKENLSLKEAMKATYKKFEYDQKNRTGVAKRTGSPVSLST